MGRSQLIAELLVCTNFLKKLYFDTVTSNFHLGILDRHYNPSVLIGGPARNSIPTHTSAILNPSSIPTPLRVGELWVVSKKSQWSILHMNVVD